MEPLGPAFQAWKNSKPAPVRSGETPLPESKQISCGICQDQGVIQRIKLYSLTPDDRDRLEALRQSKPALADYLQRVHTEQSAGLEPCQCTEMRRARQWVDYCVSECGIPQSILERQRFDSWANALNPGCAQGYWAMKHLTEEGIKRWVVLFGPPGTGKTHLLVAATGYLAQAGKNVRYFSAPVLYERMVAAVKDNNYVQQVENLKRQPILVLDDLGAERATDFAREVIHSILDHRYQERMTTIIASNAQVGDFPPRLASRLTDATLVEIVRMQGTDVRPRL